MLRYLREVKQVLLASLRDICSIVTFSSSCKAQEFINCEANINLNVVVDRVCIV